MRVFWYRFRSAVSGDESRLAVVLALFAAGGVAGWQLALVIHGAALAAAAVIVKLSRPLS